MNSYQRNFLILCVLPTLAACMSSTPLVPASMGASRETAVASADCRATPEPGEAQFIIGYGSLMQDESRKRTSPAAGPAHPVQVSGYRRGWFAAGSPVGFSTTFLGVVPEASARMNAVIYRVEANELTATDLREAQYCRTSVPSANIQALENEGFQRLQGQVWIYTNRPESIAVPSDHRPIVQSYVDIFVSGCLEQEQRFKLDGFARQCLLTTSGWSSHWINDRLYPRRPFIYQPKASQIDSLLSQHLSEYFSKVRIE